MPVHISRSGKPHIKRTTGTRATLTPAGTPGREGPSGGPIPAGGNPGDYPTPLEGGGYGWDDPSATYASVAVPKKHGAVGDGTTDDTVALQATITAAASFGLPVDLGGLTYKITNELTAPAGTRIRGRWGQITQTTAGKSAIVVTGDDVLIEDCQLTGRQSTINTEGEHGVRSIGTVAAPINLLRVRNVVMNQWGSAGVHLEHVHNFSVTDCNISNIAYAGVMAISVDGGFITGNDISDVDGSDVAAYGIALTRYGYDDLTTAPRSKNVRVRGNTVAGVPWEGIDTHGGENITITGNVVNDCTSGIAVVGSANVSGAITWAPVDVHVGGNVIDSGVTDGSARYGIAFTGATGVLGAPLATATGTITGNTIRGHGDQSSTISGAIYLHNTEGVAVVGNAVIEPSPFGIFAGNDNYGISISGNTVADPWSETVSSVAAILVPSGYVTGSVVGNTHHDAGGKSAAAYSNERGISVTSSVGVDLEAMGNNMVGAVVPASGLVGIKTTFRYKTQFVQQAGFGGSSSAPGIYFGTDQASGFYGIGTNDFALAVGEARKLRFLATAMLVEDGYNFGLGVTNGTRFGLGPTQKLGFYGATPVVRPTGTPAAAVDAASTQTLANDLRAKLIALGLIS